MTKPKQVIDKREYFQQLNTEVRDQLFAANLTACEWRFWVYLVTLDPFGDNGKDFDPYEVMLKCGMSKSTYFEAKAKFQKLGWFNFKDGKTKVTNLQACKRSKSPRPNPGVSLQDFGVSVQDFGVEHNKDRARIQTLQTYTDFLQTEADCTVAATEPFECVVDAVCSHTHPLESSPQELFMFVKEQFGTDTQPLIPVLEQSELLEEKEILSDHTPQIEPQPNYSHLPSPEKTNASYDNFSAFASQKEIQLEIERVAYDWKSRPWMLNATEFQPQMKAAVWRSNPTVYSIAGTDIPNETYVCNHLRKLNQQLKNPHSAHEAYVKLQTYWRTAIALVNPEIQSEFSSLKAASKQFAQASLLAERKQHTLEAIKDLL